VGQTTPKVGEVLRVSKIPLLRHDTDKNYGGLRIVQSGVDIDNPRKTDDTTVGHLDMKFILIIFNET
jgi:hypothetical protein